MNVIKSDQLQIICKLTLTDIQTTIYYALQCATATTQIKLVTLARCNLHASGASSCTSSACRAMEQSSHYPDAVPVSA